MSCIETTIDPLFRVYSMSQCVTQCKHPKSKVKNCYYFLINKFLKIIYIYIYNSYKLLLSASLFFFYKSGIVKRVMTT